MSEKTDILTVAREVMAQLNEAYRQGIPEQGPYEYDPHSNTSTLTAGKIERLAQAVIDLSAALESIEYRVECRERQRAVEICDLILERMIDREKCAKAIRDPSTLYPSRARAALDGKDLGGLVKGGA